MDEPVIDIRKTCTYKHPSRHGVTELALHKGIDKDTKNKHQLDPFEPIFQKGEHRKGDPFVIDQNKIDTLAIVAITIQKDRLYILIDNKYPHQRQ